ncbi:MAG: TIGR01777 family oxidoreductase [Myxococcales bacterium]|nr:TIGR01777 family oxidoreductase [Myxococcales bacterium]
MKAVVTGATGLIGRALASRLVAPVALVRDPSRAPEGARAVRWDTSAPAPSPALEGADVVFHLAGDPVAGGRWSPEKKARIRASRVAGTRSIVRAIEASAERPRALVCASAVGFYGSRGDDELTERDPAGAGFLADVCREWEAEALQAEALGVRVVLARFGVVLSPDGGALSAMLPPFRLGLGGAIAGGKQWMSWIHLDDAVGMLLHAAESRSIRGPMNVTAPAPATNAELTRALGRALGRPAVLGVPRFAIAAALGEAAEIVLASQRALPEVAARSGFRHAHREIGAALEHLLSPAAARVASAAE